MNSLVSTDFTINTIFLRIETHHWMMWNNFNYRSNYLRKRGSYDLSKLFKPITFLAHHSYKGKKTKNFARFLAANLIFFNVNTDNFCSYCSSIFFRLIKIFNQRFIFFFIKSIIFLLFPYTALNVLMFPHFKSFLEL